MFEHDGLNFDLKYVDALYCMPEENWSLNLQVYLCAQSVVV